MAARRARGATVAQVCAAGLTLPGVEVSTSYGTTALKVKGKQMARFHEDGEVLVLRTSFEDRAQLPELLEDAWRRVAPATLVKARDAAR